MATRKKSKSKTKSKTKAASKNVVKLKAKKSVAKATTKPAAKAKKPNTTNGSGQNSFLRESSLIKPPSQGFTARSMFLKD